MKIKAITVSIFKYKNSDCSNNGLSSKFDEVLIEHPRGSIEIDTDEPPENFCKIVERNLFGMTYLHIEPVARPKYLGWMSGGCICFSHDSRFAELSKYPLLLHDRQETQEQYDLLSR